MTLPPPRPQLAVQPPVSLPRSAGQAILRGIRSRCPRCGAQALFRRWLKPLDSCPTCAVDWTPQRADDFPAYIAILLTGHLLAPVIVALVLEWEIGPGWLALIVLPLATALMLSLLQPAKGGVIALQWWHGLNGFTRERPAMGADGPA